ncbi:MAG TPA: branched-chain amino acid ABC transporter substrate-binding protein [Pirellulales bacterium]|nr:branched-chain amino acid ABC transporter substrate-binding protein [Pirellulales bacterium]
MRGTQRLHLLDRPNGILLAALLLAPLVGSLRGSGKQGVVKIVSSLPRTGSVKSQTDSIVGGIRLALEEAEWQAGGFKIEYSDWDDATAAAGQWTAEAEIANAQRAVLDPDVMIYLGTYNSGAAKISMPSLNRAGLLMLSPVNTWPGLTKPDRGDPGEPDVYRPTGRITFARVVPTDDLQGPLGADWARELGARRVYVLDDAEVYGRGIATLFAARCRENGLTVLGHESIDAKAQEFKSLMTTVKSLAPDLVYFGGTTQSRAGQVAKDMAAVALVCKLMVPDACMEDAFIRAAGEANLNGRCYVTFGGLPPQHLTGKGREFVEKYQSRYGMMPEAYAIYGYEAGKVALAAIERAGKKDRRAVIDACLSIRDFDRGALGIWSFDANGDSTLRTLSGSVVKDGKFAFVKLLGG